ncbi:ATP-binding protein [Azospirillum isscasi]|uniref:histidine kinase n=1 Tax=Azospirillum isscasi TaxID=3053926 RepID=A0ABU0WC00_9PROT|nr:ATP-binding protein [Azospirillum isscasi]MDQ2101710.1 ATP-binding protein [Azospirillum isscasi]
MSAAAAGPEVSAPVTTPCRSFHALVILPLLVVALGAVLVGAGVWGVVHSLERERAEIVQAKEADAANLARAFEESIRQTVRRLDQALIHLRAEYAAAPDAFLVRAKDWQRSLYADLAFQVGVIGPDGRLRFSNLGVVPSPIDLNDREHFAVHRRSGEDALFISRPILGRMSGKWSIQFTRRIVQPDGSFGGVMVLSVNPADLTSFYGPAELGRQGSVMLVGTANRAVLARASAIPSDAAGVGRTLVDRPYLDPAGPANTIHYLASEVDDVVRIVAARRLRDYPLLAIVGLGWEELMAPYEERRRDVLTATAAAGGAGMAAILLIAWLIRMQIAQHRRLVEAQRQIADSEERWRLALEAVGDGVWDWNAATGEVFFSRGWKSMLGYGEDELANRLEEWETRVHPEDWAAAQADVRRHLDGTTPVYANEHRVRCKDGAYKWILDRGIVVRRGPDGKALRMVGTHTDITRRRQSEEALRGKTVELERSNAELEAFAYVASHDLRQPLRTINSYLALLQKDLDGTLEEETAEYIRFARDGAQRMDRLIVDLLEYSRVGRKTRPFALCAAAGIFATVRDNLSEAIAEASATLSIAEELPVLWGDENELERLFQNLIGNAVKYRVAGRPPEIRVAAAAEAEGWRFTVQDNGIGIAPEHFERIFGIFQRLHGRSEYDGTGIGLAVCKKIVEHHKGRIWVDSEPERGSTFHVLLPLPKADAP